MILLRQARGRLKVSNMKLSMTCWRCGEGEIVPPSCVCKKCIEELTEMGLWDKQEDTNVERREDIPKADI